MYRKINTHRCDSGNEKKTDCELCELTESQQ